MIPYIVGTVIYNYFMYLLSALSLTINLLKSSIKPSLPCRSVTESRAALWEPMDCSAPGLPVPGHLLKFAQFLCLTRWCHRPSYLLAPSSSAALSLSKNRGPFKWVGCSSQITFSTLSPTFPLLSPEPTIVPTTQHIFRNVYWINQCFHVACILDIILIFFLIWPLQKWNLTSYILSYLHSQYFWGFMKSLKPPVFILCISIGKDKAKVMSLNIGEGITDGKER